jgi:hypothetical protein
MRSYTGLQLRELSQEADAVHSSWFRVGGVSVQLAGDRRADVVLVPSLEPFRAESHVFDIHIRVEWVASLVPSSGRQLFDSGTTWDLYEGEAGFQFDFNAAIFGDRPFKRLLIDGSFGSATLQMSEECLLGFPHEVEPLGYPLDELLIMHRLTQEKAIELHGCGIVRADGVGNLFVGHSGAGKSTTTRLWTEREDVEVLSDDRIIVRRDDVRARDRVGVGMPGEGSSAEKGVGILRLRDSSASRSNHFAQDDRSGGHSGQDDKYGSIRMYGTPWHGEAMFASPGSASLARIFILEHGRGNVLTRLSKSQAVAELFARAFVPFHRHEYVESAMVFLEEVVEAVPVYHFAFEPDQRAVETILRLRD